MIANNNKSYLDHLNKLVDKYNNNKKLVDNDYSAFTEEIEINPKVPKF